MSFVRYVDESHARFVKLETANKFLEVLNSQDPKIQYTIETEDRDKKLAFLDVLVHNDKTGKYNFSVFRKDAITNVQVKPHSNINPRTAVGIFKGFLARAHRICSEIHLKPEIEFLIEMFVQNGHERQQLEQVTRQYKPSTGTKMPIDQSNPTVKIPWIPKMGPRLRKSFKKFGIRTVFSSPSNLKTILCSKNKSELRVNSKPGIYKLDCSCGESYIGETKKKVSTRLMEHQRDSYLGKWSSSGASEHARSCHGQINWSGNVTIAQESRYVQRKVREALEIRRNQPAMNRDQGNIATTDSWNGLFCKIKRAIPS